MPIPNFTLTDIWNAIYELKTIVMANQTATTTALNSIKTTVDQISATIGQDGQDPVSYQVQAIYDNTANPEPLNTLAQVNEMVAEIVSHSIQMPQT
jgi:hypothetical protein